MPLSNSPQTYGTVTKAFHWSIALLILTVIPLGMIAHDMAATASDPSAQVSAQHIARTATLFSLHKTLGVTVFFLALARIAWAISQPKPGLLNADNKPETFAAETVHWLLYGSLVAVPLTGWIHHAATIGFAPIWWPFGQSLPFVPKDAGVAQLFGGLHMILEKLLLIALFLHIAGAVKHHVIDRDATLRRMLPFARVDAEPPEQTHSVAPPIAALMIWALAIGIGFAQGKLYTPMASPATISASISNDPTAGNWTVETGELALSVQQFGSEVTGKFADWTADIRFDETVTQGPAGKVTVTVSIPSLTLGSVTDQAMGPDFFDSGQFPTATFDATIDRLEQGFEARGGLTIKGVEMPATLPFDLHIDGDSATMQGQLVVQRLAFGVGENMPDDSSLGLDVDIKVALTARRVDQQ